MRRLTPIRLAGQSLAGAIATLAILALGVSQASAMPLQGPTGQPAAVETAPEAGASLRVPLLSYRDLPFRTTVRQQYDFSCGSAALATLLRFQYDRPVSEAAVFKAMYAVGDKPKIQKVGFSLLDMKQYLAASGMVADGYRAPLEILGRTKVPAIVVINVGRYKHFVVVKGLRNGRVLVGDPALGLRAYERAEFLKIWDGALFVIHARAPREPVFNSEAEWRSIPDSPYDLALNGPPSAADETRALPMTFQLLPVIQLATGGTR